MKSKDQNLELEQKFRLVRVKDGKVDFNKFEI
jgi:hypothetical protein